MSDPGEEQQGAASALLLDLGQALHWAALPAPLVEARVRGAARGLGTRAQVFVMQGFLAIETGQGPARRVDLRRIDFDTHWNLQRVHALADLCAALAAGHLDVAAARTRLDRVMQAPRPYPRWLVVLGYGVYGAAVSVRVGGGALEAVAGSAVGLLTGAIHFGTIHWHRIDLQKSFLGAFCGYLAAFVLSWLLPPFDIGRAVFGGIALLVPAMVITIGTHELANDALESGVARLAYGLLRFLMLGVGIAAATRLVPLLDSAPASVSATPWPAPLVLLMVGLGGAALTVCLQGRGRDLPWITGAALLAFGTQELTKLLVGGRGSPLLAALLLGVAAHLYARWPGHHAGTIIVPGLLQLAPGFLGTQAVLGLLGRGTEGANQAPVFFDVFLVALQLVMGLVLAEVLVGRPLREPRTAATPAG